METEIARQLVAAYPHALIARKIEEHDWLLERNELKRNPAGFLVRSIQKSFPSPPGFMAFSENERKTRSRPANSHLEKTRQKQTRRAATAGLSKLPARAGWRLMETWT